MTDPIRPGPIRLGWEEWVALPDLGLPAIKAKVDTGARTSALHAFDIEPFGAAAKPSVRFAIRPVPQRDDVTITCSAPVLDRREVTSSNGEAELRYVIESRLQVGDAIWPVELTLTDRGAMAYRMLLGRQAFGDQVVVVPNESFCQPQLDYSAYEGRRARAATAPRRALRIAILGQDAGRPSTRLLVAAGEARGHAVEVIETQRCYMALNALAPEIHYDGHRLPRYDAVIPRIAGEATPYGCAVLRQFEMIGTWCLNGSDGIAAARDKLHAHQVLARARIPTPATAFADSPKDTRNLIALVGTAPVVVKLADPGRGMGGTVLAETRAAAESVIAAFRGLDANFLVQDYVAEAAGEEIRVLVMLGRAVAGQRRSVPTGETDQPVTVRAARLSRAERSIAVRAARAFRLGLAAVDLVRAADGPRVVSVHPIPGLDAFVRSTGDAALAVPVFEEIERRARPTPARARTPQRKRKAAAREPQGERPVGGPEGT